MKSTVGLTLFAPKRGVKFHPAAEMRHISDGNDSARMRIVESALRLRLTDRKAGKRIAGGMLRQRQRLASAKRQRMHAAMLQTLRESVNEIARIESIVRNRRADRKAMHYCTRLCNFEMRQAASEAAAEIKAKRLTTRRIYSGYAKCGFMPVDSVLLQYGKMRVLRQKVSQGAFMVFAKRRYDLAKRKHFAALQIKAACYDDARIDVYAAWRNSEVADRKADRMRAAYTAMVQSLRCKGIID
jgi:hypothetical protein